MRERNERCGGSDRDARAGGGAPGPAELGLHWREGECTVNARAGLCTESANPPGEGARGAVPGTEQVSVGSSARSRRAGIHEVGPPELVWKPACQGASIKQSRLTGAPGSQASPPAVCCCQVCEKLAWRGRQAAPWARQQRPRGLRGQRAASLSQGQQGALRCSSPAFLILSTTKASALFSWKVFSA